jgi:hypothetical protein
MTELQNQNQDNTVIKIFQSLTKQTRRTRLHTHRKTANANG